MQDGYTQVGAGTDDKRLAGKDLQHATQKVTADEAPQSHRIVTHSAGSGGPMKEAIEQELARHREARTMRLEHLERHYKR